MWSIRIDDNAKPGSIAYDNSPLFIVPLYGSNNAMYLTCTERY